MIYKNKRDKEAWLREKTIDSMKENIYIDENDIIEVSSGNFYKAVKTITDIPLQNNLFAQLIPNEFVGNISTATKLKTPRNIALSGDVTGNANFDGSANIIITAAVGNDSHTHSNSTITSVDASKISSGVLHEERVPNLNANKINSGILSADRIPGLDASKITSGLIDISRIPAAALERCIVVENDTARFALTKSQIQIGDSVKVTNPDNLMYVVVDDNKLNQEDGYIQYSSAIKWDTISDKPSEFTPKSHSHKTLTIRNGVNNVVYDGSENKEIIIQAGGGVPDSHIHNAVDIIEDSTHKFVTESEKSKWNSKAEGAHTHTKSQITDFPTSLKNPTALTIQLNGKNDVVYDGSAVKSVNITPTGIGAQPSGDYAQATHTHTAGQITQDATHRMVSDTQISNWDSKATGIHNHDSTYSKIGHGHAWGEISGKPENFTPSAHNQASNTITAMTGYSKPTSASSIVVGDTLNAAIGKLEKALDGKQPTGSYASASHNHNGVYQPVGSYAASNHNHDTVYAKSSHTHTVSQVSGLPTALKNPTALTISLNGTSQGAYDGSVAKSINITPASIGAQSSGSYAASSHTHDDRYFTETEINSKLSGYQPKGSYAASSHSHSNYLSNNTSGTLTGSLTVTGEILSNGNVTAFSDEKVKKNIRYIDNSVIEKLKEIKFYNYEMINDPTQRIRIGVKAQELEELFPELVFIDNNGIKSVDYIGINTYFSFAIQYCLKKLGD